MVLLDFNCLFHEAKHECILEVFFYHLNLLDFNCLFYEAKHEYILEVFFITFFQVFIEAFVEINFGVFMSLYD